MKNDAVTTMLRADLKRAEQIRSLLLEASNKAVESANLMQKAVELAEHDSYQGVKDYDARDIQDIRGVIRVAVTRPINHLLVRWDEIVSGRKSTLGSEG